MPFKKEEVTTHKWMLRVHELTFNNESNESYVNVNPSSIFPHTTGGDFFLSAPSRYVLDAETLRSLADHLDELAEAYEPPKVEKPKDERLF